MKMFAYFLPQFHEIPENNQWWGEGFTEWVKVKEAKSYFAGHVQPKHPLHENYYNLLDKETVKQQTVLMKQYHLSGMIYYHYYFKGRKLLEKPAENLLKWKDIDQPFFFCWANHDWTKSWEGKKEILVKQEYGEEKDWEKHFQYLLPFFQDERYEKKDGKPLFLLYIGSFPEKEKMFAYLDMRCRQSGFKGLYLIETYEGTWGGHSLKENFDIYKKNNSSVTMKMHLREPNACMISHHYSWQAELIGRIVRRIRMELHKTINKPYTYTINGNSLYKLMIKESAPIDAIHGLFFEWDNTPRHGERGYVITPPDKEYFLKYMDLIKDDEYVFINAWNEWAEGMFLEPCEEYGYKYLEWLKEWQINNRKDGEE